LLAPDRPPRLGKGYWFSAPFRGILLAAAFHGSALVIAAF
jgi:hypothetical protein